MASNQNSSFLCLIVGMARGGTSTLMWLLNSHPEIVAFGESLFWGRNFVPPDRGNTYSEAQGKRFLQLIANQGMPGLTPDDARYKHLDKASWRKAVESVEAAGKTPGEVFLQIMDNVAATEGVPFAVEKTPHHLMWADRILKELPETRFVVALRDPYEFMLSYKHQGDRKGARTRANLRKLYHPLGCAIVWKGYIKQALHLQKTKPSQTCFSMLGDYRREPQEAYNKILNFLGLPEEPLPEVKGTNTSFPSDERPELKADDLFWLNLVAGKYFHATQTTRRSVPFAPWPILCSFLKLPVWAVCTFYFLHKGTGGSTLAYLANWLRPSRKQAHA